MRIWWTQFTLVAVITLSAASATAQKLDLTNHASRPILILSEDHPCANTVQGPATAPDPSCLIFANDPAASYFDPSNDYFGELSYVGTSALGTNSWLITVSQMVWARALTITLTTSGVTLATNTSFQVLFDSGSGLVAPLNPTYWSATAAFGGVPLTLVGSSDPSDYPFFGTPSNPTPPPALGPPLVLSCAWAKANTVPSGCSGYACTSPPLGPGDPGSSICLTPIAQPGFALSGPLASTAMTFFSYTTIQITGGTGALADAVLTVFKWQLQETVDTDGDGVPNQYDNCPYTANPDQKDSGGLNSSAPDGVGDVCQCGDIDNNGIVNATDALKYNRASLGLSPYFSIAGAPGAAAPEKCDVNGDHVCDATDALIINRATLGLSPGVMQLCTAAVPH
jgi:hypothetical protein